ncbi:type II secretion system F family protein [Amycolatopsis sp. cmx-4-83]|uniref:type II secretion system F family protein n=1 Tax=Amycolatopsis sp. cmx-4-83 TaxID=2790940 RepID=UPI00397AC635
MTELILLVAGTCFGLGLTALALGIAGQDRDDGSVFRRRRWWTGNRRGVARWSMACGAGAIGWLVTGWPVVGIAVAAMAGVVPWLFGTGRLAARQIERLDALEDWLRSVSDVLRAGNAGLVGALQDSAGEVSPAIATEVVALAQRLRTWDFTDALLQFAEDVDDQLGDAAAAGLCVAHQQGAGTADLLVTLAQQLSADVAARREAEAERARRRSAARILLGLWAVMFVSFTVFGSDSYTAVYDSFSGQVVLALVLGVVGVAVEWLRRLGVEPPSPRFLGSGKETP